MQVSRRLRVFKRKLFRLVKAYGIPERYISLRVYDIALTNLEKQLYADIVDLLRDKAFTTKAKLQVSLVAVARGGNIPATVLHYKMSRLFEKEIEANQITFSLHYCPISTRHKDQANNEQALKQLKKELQQKERVDKVYIVDDLLDTGKTLHIIHEELYNSAWYSRTSYLFCFLKTLMKFTETSLQTKNILCNLKKPFKNKTYIGLELNTKKWLTFWYD